MNDVNENIKDLSGNMNNIIKDLSKTMKFIGAFTLLLIVIILFFAVMFFIRMAK